MSNLKSGIASLQSQRAREEAQARRREQMAHDPRVNRILENFPDEGPFRRELYPRHMEFFEAGAQCTERCFMAANRVGKTRAGACEMTWHLTGKYPHWWKGKRFTIPGNYWAAGSTAETTRDIVQAELLGPSPRSGMGMIPGQYIQKVQMRRGGPAGAVDTVFVRHVSGGISTLGFKSYAQGRQSFEGTAKHGIWVDEECPEDVYLECLTRLITTGGIIWLTFTPLKGLTPVVMRFLPSPEATQ